MVTLDIVTLRSLVAVAACGGFHKAAHALHLTQAAVSRHIQRLEDSLGEELVTRDGRGTRFTAAGERMLGHAHVILEAHDDALADFATPGNVLTVGTMDHAANFVLPELTDTLRDAFPQKTIQLRLGRSANLRESVASSRLDVALVLERLSHDSSESGALPTRWVGGEDPTSAKTTTVPLVLFDHHSGLRSAAIDTLTRAGIRHTIAAEASDLAGIHSAVRAGLGITLLPRLGRLPDRLREISDLPEPPGVIVSVQTGSHISDTDARTIRRIIEVRFQAAIERL
ncbi:LysR family transcriptional regulator [Lacisediminihabitans sp.]|jgi:DNA-binding transcriptional LysR family regulator|uniref:LysR family transcriptional regulator n=1 Tax=Lacisediminihabitans sp. TaxID=2787631 RepID=UPI002F932D5A